VDCKRIREKLLDPAVGGDPFIEGFVVLVVIPIPWPTEPRELDVVAVYTVDATTASASLHHSLLVGIGGLPGEFQPLSYVPTRVCAASTASSTRATCRYRARRASGWMLDFDFNLDGGEGVAAIHSYLNVIAFDQDMLGHRG
jgi:hypothetical protein